MRWHFVHNRIETREDIQEALDKWIEERAKGLVELARATGPEALRWRATLVWIEQKLKWYRGRLRQQRARSASGSLSYRDKNQFYQEVAASLAEVHAVAPPVPFTERRYRKALNLKTLRAPPKNRECTRLIRNTWNKRK